MLDPAKRRTRLLDLLPRIYATQPAGSAVGSIIDIMAQGLARLDQNLQRVMHDRWVGLATGAAPETGVGALDQLGALLQIYRLPPRITFLHYQVRDPALGLLALAFKSAQHRREALAFLVGNATDDLALSYLAGQFPGLDFSLEEEGQSLLVQPILADGQAPSPLTPLLNVELPEHLAGLSFEVRDSATGQVQLRFGNEVQRDAGLLFLLGDRRDAQGNALSYGQGLVYVTPEFPGLSFKLVDDGLTLLVWPTDGSAQNFLPLAAFMPLLQPEPAEAYRQRLQLTAAVLTQGLNTPRALLSLAIADLGAEPCPKLIRKLDATVARGMRLGTRKRCAACMGGADVACPNDESAVLEAWITEQALKAEVFKEPNGHLRQPFALRSDSLLTDRPVIEIQTDRPTAYPAIQSRTTGEIVLFTGNLKPGEKVRIFPALTAKELEGFRNYEGRSHHDWLGRSPLGRAEFETAKGQVRDVSDSIFYLWGDRFADPAKPEGAKRFGGPGVEEDVLRCGVLEQAVRTPQIVPGVNDWMLLTFAKPENAFDDDISTFAGPDDKDGTRFAQLDQNLVQSDGKFANMLFQALSRTETTASKTDAENLPILSLEVHWLARPPFSFNLRIPKNGWVHDADLRGAVDLLRRDMDRARPAGIRVSIDFPEPVYRDQQSLDEDLALVQVRAAWRESGAGQDPALNLATTQRFGDTQPLGEGHLGMSGLFGVTRLDWSLWQ